MQLKWLLHLFNIRMQFNFELGGTVSENEFMVEVFAKQVIRNEYRD